MMRMPRGQAATIGFVALMVAFAAVVVAASAYHLEHLRENRLQALRDTAATHARAFEDHLTQSLHVVDLTLSNLLEATAEQPTGQSTAQLTLALRRAPYLRSLSLLDGEGRVIASTNADNVGLVPAFGPLLPDAAPEAPLLRLGGPWSGRDLADGRLATRDSPADPTASGFVPALRQVDRSHRLVATLNPDHFINQFIGALPPGEGVVEVVNLDRQVLLSTEDGPDAAAPGSAMRHPLWSPSRGAPASPGVASVEAAGGPAAEVAYRASRQYPLTVLVRLDRELALAPWREQARALVLAMVPALALAVVLAVVVFRHVMRVEHERQDAELRARDRLAGRVFEASTEAIVVTDPAMRIVRVNDAYRRMTGYRDAEVIGRRPRVERNAVQDDTFFAEMWTEIQASGNWRGELIDRRSSGECYPCALTVTAVRAEDGQVLNYVCLFTDISERKAREDRIRYLSEHDCLTGLPNRSLFQDRVQQAITHARRGGHRIALLFIDLDHFKAVNDTYGHHAGDCLLVEVSRRLRSNLRESDTVCRQGGDEFLVMLPETNTPQDATRVVEKLMAVLLEPYRLAGQEVRVTPSVGIGIFPDDGEDLESLVRAADTAMYHTKSSGRAAYQFFSAQMNAVADERLALQNGLGRALEHNAFRLHYQPLVDLGSGRVSTVEALLRWHDPVLGEVPPARFIPVAEQSGLIVPIGEWVVREACRQVRSWHTQGIAAPTVAVNVSVLQFSRGQFVDSVLGALDEHGLQGSAIELEVTESLLLGDDADRMAQLDTLRAAGIRLSIDDFGTGYSSLSYLRRLPVDKIKIDRSFVADVADDPEDALIVGALIDMAHGIGLRVVAEGVETRTQQDFLHRRGCDAAQGFLFSRPLSADALAHWMRTRPLDPINADLVVEAA